MNLSTYFSSLSALEIGILVLYIAFLVSDITPTDGMASFIDSPVGMTAVLVFILYMLFYMNPVVGVLGIFVGYELLRRSAASNNRVAMMMYTPTQERKDTELAEMNPVVDRTLEEDMISAMAPVGNSSMIHYMTSEYKPVSNDVGSASLL